MMGGFWEKKRKQEQTEPLSANQINKRLQSIEHHLSQLTQDIKSQKTIEATLLEILEEEKRLQAKARVTLEKFEHFTNQFWGRTP